MPWIDSQGDWIQPREESVSEGMSVELSQTEIQREKKNEIKTGWGVENLQELWDNKKIITCIVGIQKEKDRKEQKDYLK